MEQTSVAVRQRVSRVRLFAAVGALLAGLGVIAGAFGAHGLERLVPPERIETFETGVLYHLVHALALLFLAWALDRWPSRLVAAAGWCFIGGIAIFSGSLYLLVLTGTTWLGAVTPLGGVAFIVGWALLTTGILSGQTVS